MSAKAKEPETLTDDQLEVIEAVATGEDMVVRRDDPQSLFRVLDRHDEQQIHDEIKGELIQTMAYEFNVGGKPARGLSYAGVNAAVRILNARGMARIVCPPTPPPAFDSVTDEEGDGAWECMVYAQDEVAGGGAWGMARQKKDMQLRNGSKKPDTFAKTKALSKAQRNAKLALIDEGLKAEMIAALTRGSGGVQRIQAEQSETRKQLAPHAKTEEAKKLDVQNEKIMREGLGFTEGKIKATLDAHRTIEEKRRLWGWANAQVDAKAGAD